MPLLNLPIPVLADIIARREVNPNELVEAALDQCRLYNGALNAWVGLDAKAAVSRATELTGELLSGASRSGLHGIPFGVKDIFITHDYPTTACSAVRHPAADEGRDAAIVARLISLGALLLGKLTTYEHATGGPSFDLPWPPALNPWDTDRTTGGSSSGSAVAVAASMCSFALGSDTGGSVRTPAAYCGISSIRPSAGVLSPDGVLPLAQSFDTVGVMAQRISDCRFVMTALGKAERLFDEAQPISVAGLRLGVPRNFGPDVALEAGVQRSLRRVVDAFGKLGGHVEEVDIPPIWDFTVAFRILMLREAFSLHGGNLQADGSRYGAALRYRLWPGRLITDGDIEHATALANRLRRRLQQIFERVDVLVLPAAASGAPRLDAMRLAGNFSTPMLTAPFSIGGNPVATFPVGLTDDGLPVGIQFAAGQGQDAFIMRVACRIEEELPFDAERADLTTRLSSLPAMPPHRPHPTVPDLEEADAVFSKLKGRLDDARAVVQ